MYSDTVSGIRGFVFDMKRLQWREGAASCLSLYLE